ncbi:hypothetical protein [Bradyrhizobium elkanii]|uniref:hypothetical protein n=2 Tax=Bradyrhizobium elkanii TaxID=29448 RepID=UPI001AECD645|nr:hypothetical protein [Bradyrhizobium elkanii]
MMLSVGPHDLEDGASNTVTRKTLQARSEQALVVIILSTGALIGYLGLALSRL